MRHLLAFFVFATLPACVPPAGMPPGGASIVSDDVRAMSAGVSSEGKPIAVSGSAMPARSGGGVGHDFSWSRIGHPSTQPVDEAWLASHPRLGGTPLQAGGGVPAPAPAAVTPNWTLTYGVTADVSPALFTTSFTSKDASKDRMFAFAQDSMGNNALVGFSNIYTAPSALWSLTLDSAIKGSSIATDLTGTIVYVVTSGKANGANATPAAIYAIDNGTGTGWKATWGAAGTTVKFSFPWVDFTTGMVWVADENGHLVRAGSGGGTVWDIDTSTSIHSTPLAYNGLVWVGTDAGAFSVYSYDSTTTLVSRGTFNLCKTSTNCVGSDAIWGTPYIDVVNDRLLLGQNGGIWQVNGISTCVTAGNCVATKTNLPGVAAAIFRSSVLVDQNSGNYVYAGTNNKLFRCTYSASTGIGTCGGTASESVALAPAVPVNTTYPVSSPLQYSGSNFLYIGDGAGNLNRINPSGSSMQIVSTYQLVQGSSTAISVDSTPLLDFGSTSTGSVYFGATMSGGGAAGGYASVGQLF